MRMQGGLKACQNQLPCRARSNMASIKAVVGVSSDSFIVFKYHDLDCLDVLYRGIRVYFSL